MCESPPFAHIDVKDNASPFDLVAQWFEEAETHGISRHYFNLATSTISGEVSNRSLALADFVNNKFIFLTNERSLKGQILGENPKVTVTFLVMYLKNGRQFMRQIRCQGSVTKLPYEQSSKYYENDPVMVQIRAHVCMQGKEVDWNEQKQKYDELLKKVQNGLKLKMPEYLAGYEITANTFDFYEAFTDQIADRMVFKKRDNNSWSFHRVAS